MIGELFENAPALDITLEQCIDVQEWVGILPAGRKFDPGNAQVAGAGKCLVKRRQSRGLSVESNLHAHSFSSAEAASPDSDEPNGSLARGGH